MSTNVYRSVIIVASLIVIAGIALGQAPPLSNTAATSLNQDYRLGPLDEITVRVQDLESMAQGVQFSVEQNGEVSLPVAGRIRAAGLTMKELEEEITKSLSRFLRAPEVSVSILKFGSQPVAVLGAVTNPGVHQIEGGKTLIEVISLAGGLRSDAGSTIKITRKTQYGPIPLTGCKRDPTGMFTVAEVSVSSIVRATLPAENILVQPYDVVAVPTADFVYVLGAVHKPGALPLGDRGSLSILQALAIAEGLERDSEPKHARIIQRGEGNTVQSETPVNVRQLLKGKTADIALAPNDILFIPTASGFRGAAIQAIDIAASAAAMGLAIH